MANYTFSQDLVNDILFRAGEGTDGSSDFQAVALQYLNRAYQALVNGGSEIDPNVQEDWWWARKDPPGVLNLVASITTGTVNVTNNSTSITFSSAPAISVAGYFFRVNDQPDVFRIASHTAASTSATLDAAYTGPNAAAAAFKLFKTEYTLPADLIRIISPMRIYQGVEAEVDGVELTALERNWPIREIESGPPTQFAMVGETKLRFNKYGPVSGATPNMIRVEFDYIYRPLDLTNSASEEPVVPRQYRRMLADIAVVFLFVDKNDDRASPISQVAKQGLQAMANEQRKRMVNYSRNYGRILARQERTNKHNRPLRTDSGVIIG